MNSLRVFESTKVEIIELNGKLMFEVFTTGMALGYVTSSGFPYKSRIQTTMKNAEIKPTSHGVKSYFTEEQLYDFMLEARTEKVKPFRKWLTTEVLPSIHRTGSYTQPQYKQMTFEGKQYEYFDKTYNGKSVLSVVDMIHLTGISGTTITWAFRTKGFIKDVDFYVLRGADMMNFKRTNPKIGRYATSMELITESGFRKFCEMYNIKLEKPKCFQITLPTVPGTPTPPKKELVHVIENENLQANITRAKNTMTAISELLRLINMYNVEKEQFDSYKKTIFDLGVEELVALKNIMYEKVKTTTVYKQ